MASIWLRRLVVIIISLIIGFALTYFEVHSSWTMPEFLNKLPGGELIGLGGKQFGLGTTFEDYGGIYTVLTILSFAIGFGVLLDGPAKSEMLPH